ncbi:MAG TPA: HAD-IB family phosphatase [Gaiellaceae bacterium]|nr:HAD-IB family phosphatase [Gaiellaceae bacterium]
MQLVLDWDGTVTERDSLWMLLDRFGDPEVFARVEGKLVAGEISFRQVMELEFATVTAPLDEVLDFLLREVRIRAGFAELARAYRPLILSSGFHELIEPLLAREGVELELRANRLDVGADGWRVRWRDAEPCPECGDLCKRRSLPGGPLAYVGDGYSDRCAALAADRVFARDGLADWLEESGIAYERFDDLADVARALARPPGAAVEARARTTGRK